MEHIIKQFVEQAQGCFEQALIDACMNKGFVLNIATAPDFHAAEYKGTITLYHTSTMTAICIYLKEPMFETILDDNKTKIVATYKFQEI